MHKYTLRTGICDPKFLSSILRRTLEIQMWHMYSSRCCKRGNCGHCRFEETLNCTQSYICTRGLHRYQPKTLFHLCTIDSQITWCSLIIILDWKRYDRFFLNMRVYIALHIFKITRNLWTFLWGWMLHSVRHLKEQVENEQIYRLNSTQLK